MNKKMLKNMDWSILVCSILLGVFGLLAIFSASLETSPDEFNKQLIWFALSIPVLIIIIVIDYKVFAKLSPILFGISILLLIGVLFTKPINGSTRWFDLGFFSLQPTDIAKICYILFLAYIMTILQSKEREEINKFWKLSIIFAIIIVPVILIAIEPDYGNAILFLVVSGLMLLVAGIKMRYVLIALLLLVILVPLLYFTIMPAHVKNRIDVFLNPGLDPRGKGYNVIQSKLAIGSGMLTGSGLFNGTQTQLGFLYPKTTDFVYAVIAEEMGFIGASVIIILNVILVTRAIAIAKTAREDLGSYIAMGIAAIFLYHMTENIGMTMGLLPITGIPLLFVSYGGSSIITNFIAIGVLINISMRRQKEVFAQNI